MNERLECIHQLNLLIEYLKDEVDAIIGLWDYLDEKDKLRNSNTKENEKK